MVTNQIDSTLNFYLYSNKSWSKVGSNKIETDDIYDVDFTDMDGDNRNEIIIYSHPNMNGNMWPTVYYCSNKDDSIRYAGSFETSFEIKKDQKRLETDYVGSWWMPNMKTIYMWRNEKLVPIKKVEISLKIADMKHDDMILRYYENPTYDQDTLKLIFKKDYKKKYVDMYEKFFENN